MKRVVLLMMAFYVIANTTYADNITINVGDSEAIWVLSGTDYNGFNFQGTWYSSKPSVADVKKVGPGSTNQVVGYCEGVATITCSYVYTNTNNQAASGIKTWTVTVRPVSPTSISLNYTSVSLEPGETRQLSATVSPSGASQSVTWSVVSGSGVASVSSSGLVTANATGTATIRATSSVKSSVYKDCTVTVTQPTPPTSISLNYTSISLAEGNTRQLTATVLPSDASQSVTWSVVSGSSYASVSSSGLVTALAAGTATVRATSSVNSSVYKDCTVTVSAATLNPGTWSGNTLTIGGSATNSVHDVPYGNYYKYSTAQMLYTPTEIGKSGTLNSIAFKVASSSSFATSEVKVYLGHKSGKFSSTTNYVTSSSLTLVYSGTPTLGSTTGWETLTFNQGSFTYNGTDNLVVVVTRKSTSYTDLLKYYCYSGSGYTLYRRSDDDTTYGNATNTSNSYTTSTCRPSIQMVFAGTTPTSINLNTTSLSLEVGGTKQLTATVLPSGASQSVTWSVVSGSSYASVSSSGLVTALAAGTATVRATSSVKSSVYKDCTVTVTSPVPGGNTVTIGNDATSSVHDVPYSNFYKYSTAQMLYTPTEIGKSGTLNSIAFKVASSSSFATSEVKVYLGHKSTVFSSASDYVNSNNLTLVYSGTPTLGSTTGWETLSFNQGSFTYNGTDNLVVVVTRKSTSYTNQLKYYCYSGSGYTLYRRNDSETTYGDVTNTSYSYSTSTNRPSIQMVFAESPSPTSINLNTTSVSLEVGGTKQLTATVLPSGASQSVTWSVISGSSVASVSSTGLVTAKATGTATVRATSSVKSSVYKECTVTVTSPISGGTTVTIGGSATSSIIGVPYGSLYFYSTAQMLYTPTEIGRSGTINGIAFKVADSRPSSHSSSQVKVYLGHKSSNFSSENDYVASSDLTLVYSGTPKLGLATGWETIVFNQGTFTYNGTDNLVVVVTRKNSMYTNSYYCYSGSGYTLYRHSDNDSTYGDVTNTSNSYSPTTWRPAVQLGFGVSYTPTISLNTTSISLGVGETKQLTAAVLPNGISQQSVTWSVVSGSGVASVSSSGLVTAQAAGTATIRAALTLNGSVFYSDCAVTVKNPPSVESGIWFGDTLVTIVGDSVGNINVVPYANGYRYSTIQMIYTPTEIGKSGMINSIAFKVASSSSFATSEVKIYLGHKSSKFSGTGDYVTSSNLTLVYSGSPTLGQATGWETLKFNQGTFTYNGTDNLVVVVTRKSGGDEYSLRYSYYYTGIGYTLLRRSDGSSGYGDVTNTSYSYSTSTYRPAIQMGFEGTTPTSISLNATSVSLEVGGTKQLTATVLPSGVSQNVIWSVVSGSSVASVSSSGLVTAKAVGTAIIRATSTAYSSVYKDCTVTVTEKTLNDGDTFIANTAEGVEMTFKVISATSKTCQVGTGANSSSPAVSTNTQGNITIPSTIEGFSVKGISNYAFYGCNSLSSVNISNGVTTLGYLAFCRCTNLSSVSIPSSLTTISEGAFSRCSSLSSISIPGSVTSIGPSAFYYCSSLSSITIPNNVTSIEDGTFYGCSNLTTITIPSGLSSIKYAAFAYCVELASITIPANVTTIGEAAFLYCSKLASITIPNSVTSIGTAAFSRCSGLTSIKVEEGNTFYDSRNGCNAIIHTSSNSLVAGCMRTSIPESVTTIGNYAFSRVNGVNTIAIPNSVTTIGEGAFTECGDLTSIIIPKSVTIIGAGAFYDCGSLRMVTIGDGVTTIRSDAFANCPSLVFVRVNNRIPVTIGENTFSNCANATLYVPAGCKAAYEAADYWKEFLEIVEMEPEGGEAIEVDGLYYEIVNSNVINAKIGQETLPSDTDVVMVVEAASGHEYGGDIVIPESITYNGNTYDVVAIAECAFAEYKVIELTSVVIPNSVVLIDDEAFVESSTLERVEIPNSVKYIGEDVFGDCESLSEIVSYIIEPFAIHTDVFRNIANDATLYVPFGTKVLYEAATGWNNIANIVEMEPTETEDTDISQMDNVIYIEPIEAMAGSQIVLSVKMKNAVEAVGFGFDLVLPDGITVPKKDENYKPMAYLSTERTNSDNTGFIADYKLDGTLQVQAYDKGGMISGNDGEIVKVTINLAEEMMPGDYPIVLKNSVIVPTTSLSIRQSYFKTTLTIADYIVGDANHDGYVDPGDLTAISHYLLERPDATFNIKAADANGDKRVDPGDLTAVSHLIMWGTIDRPNQLKARKKVLVRDPQ